MQEKKKNPPKNLEREREREPFFFVRENYAQNIRDSDKFIVVGINKKSKIAEYEGKEEE